MVRLLVPTNPNSRVAPAHRPRLPESPYGLPLVSVVDSLPTVRVMYTRFYGFSPADQPHCRAGPENSKRDFKEKEQEESTEPHKYHWNMIELKQRELRDLVPVPETSKTGDLATAASKIPGCNANAS